MKHCSEASNYSMSVPNCSTASTIKIGVEKRKSNVFRLTFCTSQIAAEEFSKGTEILCTYRESEPY